MIRFFNTLTRRVEEFVPLIGKKVGMYSCGPTVYNYPHIGNLSTFLFVDLLKRYLLYRGYEVFHVMNLTDVDDKTIRGARQDKVSLGQYTQKYAEAFFHDLSVLGIMPADIYPRATEHIPEMVALIKRLLESGYAYEKEESIYFRISAFRDYGKLAALDFSGLKRGASGIKADEYAKEEADDFVLWKNYTPDDGDNFWDTEIGRGRPGWHIECSAMSMKYLGETFDIHTGGIDLIFPHHQNEIAQSEAATGSQFVRYWLHRHHLKLGEDKMSKSAGNFQVLRNIVHEDLDALAFRYLAVSTHYRSSITFSEQSLGAARQTVVNLIGLRSKLANVEIPGDDSVQGIIDATRQKFIEHLDNDLDAPRALAEIFSLTKEIEKQLGENRLTIGSAKAVNEFLGEANQILGVMPEAQAESEQVLTPEQLAIMSRRDEARRQKNWSLADELRELLAQQGIQLEDTAAGTKWSFKRP
ncbi:MAG: cysteine--tRNA ligase [bacterium]|nr:cysteine--tRNA ligase [bacterium]